MATKTAPVVSFVEPSAGSNYERFVNPQWVSLLNLLGMNATYERCEGCELFTSDGFWIFCPAIASTMRATITLTSLER